MRTLPCPHCGKPVPIPYPLVAVDALVEDDQGRILLVQRRYPPAGWALPGGFVEAEETLEEAVARELREETGLTLEEARQFHAYSGPHRDPRHPMISVVFSGCATGTLAAGDDAADARFFPRNALPAEIAFDHRRILADYAARRPLTPG
ncbi:MAG: NUDIX hydrolase [Candidatus Eisenbacteria sp.]|nr:NUDIX hydrolase [Candidatus Eisenbacteria bacterium]